MFFKQLILPVKRVGQRRSSPNSDPQTGEVTRLIDPRPDAWLEHGNNRLYVRRKGDSFPVGNESSRAPEGLRARRQDPKLTAQGRSVPEAALPSITAARE